MLTMIEPENTGSHDDIRAVVDRLLRSALAMPGLLCVSTEITSILRPRMPPAALISLKASLTPLSKLVPAVAPPPDSSTMS